MIEITDRYGALGIPLPDPKTMCKGECEGTGYFPHYKGNGPLRMERQPEDDAYDILWEEQHAKPHKEMEIIERCEFHKKNGLPETGFDCKDCVLECDGWHFLKCPGCNGTGKKAL